MTSRLPPGPNDHLFGMRTMSWMKADVLGSYAKLQRAHGDCVSFRTGPYRLFVFFHPDQVYEVLVKHAKSMIPWGQNIPTNRNCFAGRGLRDGQNGWFS